MTKKSKASAKSSTSKVSTPDNQVSSEENGKKIPYEVVSYVPNGADFGTRPKNTALPAFVVNRYDQEITIKENDQPVRKTRSVVNLTVLQDSEALFSRKLRVPHKDDAVGGESYYE